MRCRYAPCVYDRVARNTTHSDRVNTCMMGDGAAAFVLRAAADDAPLDAPELLYVSVMSIGAGVTPGARHAVGGRRWPLMNERARARNRHDSSERRWW